MNYFFNNAVISSNFIFSKLIESFSGFIALSACVHKIMEHAVVWSKLHDFAGYIILVCVYIHEIVAQFLFCFSTVRRWALSRQNPWRWGWGESSPPRPPKKLWHCCRFYPGRNNNELGENVAFYLSIYSFVYSFLVFFFIAVVAFFNILPFRDWRRKILT